MIELMILTVAVFIMLFCWANSKAAFRLGYTGPGWFNLVISAIGGGYVAAQLF